MTTFNTGNPLGSTDVYDRYDNSENLDNFSNGPLDAYPDRFGVSRQSLQGIRNASQYVDLGPYAAGLVFTSRNQVFSYLGEFYAPGPAITLPYTTTGAGAGEIANFRSVGDATLRQDLAASTGASLVGYGAGTVVDKLATIDDALVAIDEALVAGGSFLSVTSTPTVTLDSSDAETFGVVLDENVTSLILVGGAAGKDVRINVIFTQDATGGRVVTKPADVRLPDGVAEIAELGAGQITFCTFTRLNGVGPWLYERRAVFSTALPKIALPKIAGENATFNDEGASTAGWVTSNATASVASSYLRNTKVAGGSNSSLTKALTFTPSNTAYILYGRARCHLGAVGAIWLLNGSKEVAIWFGSATADQRGTSGAVSICGTTGASTRNVVQVASGLSLDTTPVDFALQYDPKFSTLTCWFREADGRWKWKGRVACNWFSAADIQVLLSTASAAGTWVEVDYLMLAQPNLALLSDSIGEGKTLFSPDPALALTNDESTWMRHAPIYQDLRNNLVVNQGVGGNTSTQMLARVADVTSTGAKVVFLHASSNDEVGGVSQATRKSNIQSTVNAIAAAGGATVLLNASYGTQSGSDNTPTPDLRDYMVTSWNTQLNTLTGVSMFIDTMQAVKDGSNFLSAALAADGIHFNVAGHTAVGAFIKDKE